MTTLEMWLFIIIGVLALGNYISIGKLAQRIRTLEEHSQEQNDRLADVENRTKPTGWAAHDFDEVGYCSHCGLFADEIGRPERLQKAATPPPTPAGGTAT